MIFYNYWPGKTSFMYKQIYGRDTEQPFEEPDANGICKLRCMLFYSKNNQNSKKSIKIHMFWMYDPKTNIFTVFFALIDSHRA